MAKQGIVIANQDPKLYGIVARLNARRDQLSERLRFIEKQAKDAFAAYNTDHKALWKEIEDYLIETGKLPADHDRDTMNLHLDAETTLISTAPKGEPGEHEKLLKLLMGSLFD